MEKVFLNAKNKHPKFKDYPFCNPFLIFPNYIRIIWNTLHLQIKITTGTFIPDLSLFTDGGKFCYKNAQHTDHTDTYRIVGWSPVHQ